jgi:translation elongation factor EF-Tu-like GTPase
MASEPYANIAAANGFLKATFKLIATSDGGRASGIHADYRPNWSIGVADPTQQSGAPVLVDDAERVEPGESAPIRLFPMWPEFWANVEIGTQLFAFEGSHLVGTAVVTEVHRPTGTG